MFLSTFLMKFSVSVEEKVTLPGIISSTWKSGCAKSKSNCKRKIVDFCVKALCFIHNMSSNIVIKVIRNSVVYLFEQRVWVLSVDLSANVVRRFGIRLVGYRYISTVTRAARALGNFPLHLNSVALIILAVVLTNIEDKIKEKLGK